jgi:hypothetical protein
MDGLPAAWERVVIARYTLLWHSVHRRQLVVSGSLVLASLVASVTLLIASCNHLDSTNAEKDAEDAGLTATSMAAEDLARMNADLARRESRTRALKSVRFDGPADRVGWAESIDASILALHPLTYSAEVGTVSHTPLPDAILEWYSSRGLGPPQFTTVDLNLNVSGLHEDELVDLLNAVRRQGGGITRIERCKLLRRSDNLGIDADCALRRYSVGRGAAEVAVEGQSDVVARGAAAGRP